MVHKEERDRLFGPDKMFDLDRFETEDDYRIPFDAMWQTGERGEDPMGYIVRQVMTHLKPQHRDLLERVYFIQETIASIARERKCTERAVRGMLDRARANFLKAWNDHALDYIEVPIEER